MRVVVGVMHLVAMALGVAGVCAGVGAEVGVGVGGTGVGVGVGGTGVGVGGTGVGVGSVVGGMIPGSGVEEAEGVALLDGVF